MSRCAKCGATGKLWEWTTEPCADGRRLGRFWLCDDHDIERNRELLVLLGDPEVEAKMAAYEAQVRATVVEPT